MGFLSGQLAHSETLPCNYKQYLYLFQTRQKDQPLQLVKLY